MSVSASNVCSDGPRYRSLYARSLVVAALPLIELMALGVRFDTKHLEGASQWWARLLGQTHIVSELGIAAVAAALVFGGAKLENGLQRLAGQLHRSQHVWPLFLLCHLVALSCFTWLTAFILEGDMRSSPSAAQWFFVWVATGLAAAAFWGMTLLPPSLWLSVSRRGFRLVLIGTTIGGAAWATGSLTEKLWLPLGSWTLGLVHAFLGLLMSGCVYEPSSCTIGSQSFSVRIDHACSGYQGIGLIWVFLTLYLWFNRGRLRFPHVLLLLPIGTVMIWLANAVRITALIAVGTWFSPAVALGGFHSLAGWLAFIAVALGLVAVAGRARFFAAAGTISSTAKASNPSAAYLAPFLAILAVTMITGAFSSGFDWLYPLRVLAAVATLWFFRHAYAEFRWNWSWQAVAIGAAVFALWIMLVSAPSDTAAAATSGARLAGLPVGLVAAWSFFRVVGYVITVPVAEELAFRGFLTRRLIAAEFQDVPPGRFTWVSFLGSSAMFGALHGGAWFAGCLAGALFAIALYRRGRIADAILAHATANGLIAIYVLMTGKLYLWS